MAQVVNYYTKMGSLGKPGYFNPNAKDGAPVHPFRMIISAPPGHYKSNTCLNLVNVCACFEFVYLVSANGKTEPLYVFLKSKLGPKLVIIEKISNLPPLKTDTEADVKKGAGKKKPKKKPAKEESENPKNPTRNPSRRKTRKFRGMKTRIPNQRKQV